jgi:hypothetical protein
MEWEISQARRSCWYKCCVQNIWKYINFKAREFMFSSHPMSNIHFCSQQMTNILVLMRSLISITTDACSHRTWSSNKFNLAKLRILYIIYFERRSIRSTIMPTTTQIHENDVLLGRGGLNYEHEGNGKLRHLACSRVREYQGATKKQKGAISRYALHIFFVEYPVIRSLQRTHQPSVHREILQQIHGMEPVGRFLQKNYTTHEWEEVAENVAREKVCQVSPAKISFLGSLSKHLRIRLIL